MLIGMDKKLRSMFPASLRVGLRKRSPGVRRFEGAKTLLASAELTISPRLERGTVSVETMLMIHYDLEELNVSNADGVTQIGSRRADVNDVGGVTNLGVGKESGEYGGVG